MWLKLVPALVLVIFGLGACSSGDVDGPSEPEIPDVDSVAQPLENVDIRSSYLQGLTTKLAPLHQPFGEPQPGDWILRNDEDGQTFSEYLDDDPVMPRGKRRTLYIQPVGEFSEKEREIIDLSAEFMGLYFNLPVTIKETVDNDVIPDDAKRKNPGGGQLQILSTHVLYDLLKPRLPEDAAAYIAFTSTDLWPGKGWNFVFGQASLRSRVGVWSIYRNGNADGSDEEFRTCLLRTLKTATHETGHMFTMEHCIAYECNMCGSNNRAESDRRPLALCPECLAKVCYATKTDPKARYEKLLTFCEKHKLDDEAKFYRRLLGALEK